MFRYIYKKSTFFSIIDVCYIICLFVVSVQKCRFISSYLPVNEKGCISSFLLDYFLSKILSFAHQIISILNRTIFEQVYRKIKFVQTHIWYFSKLLTLWFNAWVILCTLQIGCNSKRLFTLTYILWVSRRCLFIYSLEGQQNISVCIRGMWY